MSEGNSPLVVGVSTRALFDLREEHQVFEDSGVESYAALQRQREKVLLPKGTGFEVVERLLSLNPVGGPALVEVVLISRNSPDLSLRAFNSVAEYGLGIKHGSFVSGRPVGPLVQAWNVDLFLSNEDVDVREAANAGTAAARLHEPPKRNAAAPTDEVRIAFDGDAVLFSAESDEIYKEQGLAAFGVRTGERARPDDPRAIWGVSEKVGSNPWATYATRWIKPRSARARYSSKRPCT